MFKLSWLFSLVFCRSSRQSNNLPARTNHKRCIVWLNVLLGTTKSKLTHLSRHNTFRALPTSHLVELKHNHSNFKLFQPADEFVDYSANKQWHIYCTGQKHRHLRFVKKHTFLNFLSFSPYNNALCRSLCFRDQRFVTSRSDIGSVWSGRQGVRAWNTDAD